MYFPPPNALPASRQAPEPAAARGGARAAAGDKAPPRGFTLTELLVVIAIIAMLVAIVSVAVVRALDTAKQTRIKTEIDQLDAAMKAYKDRYGSFPPCNLAIDDPAFMGNPMARLVRLNQIKSHVARAFPRYNFSQMVMDPWGGPNIPKLEADLRNYVDTKNFRPDQALVFWLGGFNPNPQDPFLFLNNPAMLPKASRTAAFMEFDPTRLAIMPIASNGPWTVPTTFAGAVQCPSYYPAGSKATLPFVYFDATTYSQPTMYPMMPFVLLAWNASTVLQNSSSAGVAMPYALDVNNDQNFNPGVDTWVNPDSFQIISAGLDDRYGSTLVSNPQVMRVLRLYPVGNPAPVNVMDTVGYDSSTDLADDDNVTNFCGKARLGDAKP